MDDKEILLKKIKEWKNILPRKFVFVKIAYSDSIIFEIRTKEDSRHIPHIHVQTSCASISIAIQTNEILAQSGHLNEKIISKAQDWILKNKKFVIDKWNEYHLDKPIVIDI